MAENHPARFGKGCLFNVKEQSVIWPCLVSFEVDLYSVTGFWALSCYNGKIQGGDGVGDTALSSTEAGLHLFVQRNTEPLCSREKSTLHPGHDSSPCGRRGARLPRIA